MSLFCQHFRRYLPNSMSWVDEKDRAADLIINTVEQYSPGFQKLIVGKQINSPLDIEEKLNMVGGDIFHGALHIDQLYSMRPVVGAGNYRMPISGLYLGGSGAHPGGGVSGLPGKNCANAVLRIYKSLIKHLKVHSAPSKSQHYPVKMLPETMLVIGRTFYDLPVLLNAGLLH